MSIQIKPASLKPGAKIGVVSPAYWFEPVRMQQALNSLQNMGYTVCLGESTQLKENRFAGSPEQRAADIMRMFVDPDIDAIICARGGYGTNRVAPLLDYNIIRNNPKIFIGYSDITGLLSSIAQRAKLVTFHGPMLTTFADHNLAYNLNAFQQLLNGKDKICIQTPPECKARVLVAGSASGPCWGGNLSLVIERLGTPDQIDTRGAILFLEDIDEQLYAFERMLLQLRHSGSLAHINGLVIGEMTEMTDAEIPFGKNTDEIVLDICANLGIPILSNFPCGHGNYQVSLPISHPVELHAIEKNPHIFIPESPLTN